MKLPLFILMAFALGLAAQPQNWLREARHAFLSYTQNIPESQNALLPLPLNCSQNPEVAAPLLPVHILDPIALNSWTPIIPSNTIFRTHGLWFAPIKACGKLLGFLQLVQQPGTTSLRALTLGFAPLAQEIMQVQQAWPDHEITIARHHRLPTLFVQIPTAPLANLTVLAPKSTITDSINPLPYQNLTTLQVQAERLRQEDLQ